MKRTITFYAIAVISTLMLMNSEAEAQCPNPSGCIYGDTRVTISYGATRVEGYSSAQADYTAGLNFNPRIEGSIYRTDFPETDLDYRTSTGNGSSVPAVINLFTTNFVNGKTYCNYTNYFAVRRSTGQTSFIGYIQDCKTISIPPPPTPTPTPCDPLISLPCATPTPTPTPVPSPTVKLSEVGFRGDRLIRQLETGNYIEAEDADGTVPTWKSNNNPKYPVAYLKGKNPTLFAKFTVTPSLTTPLTALLRIMRGNNPVTFSNASITLSGSQASVDNISIPFSNLESGEFIKKSEYEFTWQISFDNGSTWKDVENKSKHDVHWLNSDPTNESTFEPFVNATGRSYQGLYDEALEWSTGKVESNEPDVKKVVQKINSRLAGKILYDPGIGSINDIPLKILNGEQGGKAVCRDNALIFAGLLRSIGLEGIQEKYHWGGEESSDKRNYYCPPGGCTAPNAQKPIGNRLSMQSKRDVLGSPGSTEYLPRNPSFAYHATVSYDNRSFDPSYGIVENNVELLTAVRVVAGQPPQCVYNAAATALRVTRNSFGNSLLSANNDTNKVCNPVLSSDIADSRNFRFDGNGGADIAVVQSSDGDWKTRNENGDLASLLDVPKNATSVYLPGDYDGDGLTDPAVWIGESLGYRMSSNYYKMNGWNFRPRETDEKALSGDFDGDGITDVAAWRGSDGRWTVWRSSDQVEAVSYWGGSSFGDIPAPGDYDGDGKTDIAVFRSNGGEWWILQSSNGSYWAMQWGASGDIPVQGDYDGDGKTDLVVARPSNGVWYMLESESNYGYRGYAGPAFSADDWPVPADYNGDSKTDVAVWFKSTGSWFIVDSQTMESKWETFGTSGDTPVQALSVNRP